MHGIKQGQPPKALERRAPDVTAAFTGTAEDPAERLAGLRASCPVALQEGTGTNGGGRSAWLITRYGDIVDAAKDTESFGQSIRFASRRRPPLEANPPEHRSWRSLLQPFFLPKTISRLEPLAAQIVGDAVDKLIAEGGGDAAAEIARPLPPQILLAWMNQPIEDWLPIKEACEASYYQSSSDPDELRIFEDADAYLWDYAQAVVDDRKARPRDPASDPIQTLLNGKDGETFDEALIVGAIRLILAAGHDSTTSAVGICIEYVAENPDLQAVLRSEPKQIAAAIEEILRLRPPVIQMPRTVMRDTRIGEVTLEADDAALLMFASGNLDDGAFPDAATFKLNRSPNRHLSFGTGIHTCIGNILARQEMRVVLEQLVARTSSFAMDSTPEHEFWHPYGATALPLRLAAASI